MASEDYYRQNTLALSVLQDIDQHAESEGIESRVAYVGRSNPAIKLFQRAKYAQDDNKDLYTPDLRYFSGADLMSKKVPIHLQAQN